MDGVVREKPACKQLFDPASRIIVDADMARLRGAQAGMVEEREMIEAQLARGLCEKQAQFLDRGAF